MRNLKNALTFCFIFIINTYSQEATGITFNEFLAQVNLLEKNEQFGEAKELTMANWDKFIEERFSMIKELEYLNEKLELYEENLKLWSKAHDDGYFFFLNTRIARFKPYLDFPQFEPLTIKDAELKEAALSKSSTVYKVVEPIKSTF